MNHISLNDVLNLKGTIMRITAYIKSSSEINGPDNTEGFLNLLFTGIENVSISEEFFSSIGNSYNYRIKSYYPPKVIDIQKALSGNISLEKLKPFTDLVRIGAYDLLFFENLDELVQDISASSDSDAFFKLISDDITLMYFQVSEIDMLRSLVQKQDYCRFVVELLKHGFCTMENIPAYFGNRIYEQALTIDFDSPTRYYLMKESADNGNERACLEFANYLTKRKDYDLPLNENELSNHIEAISYLLKASRFDPALWNIAFILQRDEIPKKIVNHVNQVLRVNTRIQKIREAFPDIVANELDIVHPSPSSKNPLALMTSYKINFLLSYKNDVFPKALNSLANALINKRIIVDENPTVSANTLIEKYRHLAANRQDIAAITNIGSSWVKQLTDGKIDFLNTDMLFVENIRKIELSAQADMQVGKYNLAVAKHIIFLESLKNDTLNPSMLKEVKDLLNEALEANKDKNTRAAELFYRLEMLRQIESNIQAE